MRSTFGLFLAAVAGAMIVVLQSRAVSVVVPPGTDAAGAEVAADAVAADTPATRPAEPGRRGITFVIHAYDGIGMLAWGPLKSEIEKRGYSCKVVHSPKGDTKTPNRDRAKLVLEALKDVEGDVVLVGVSNQGLFMPLVAAERPVRRIVMINAVVPTPGKSFEQAFDFHKVFATKFTRRLAQQAPGMLEVCPLKEMPKVEYVYICGEKDDAIRPEWEQSTARGYLHVEPVVIQGARHANIVYYVKEVVDAATKGLGDSGK